GRKHVGDLLSRSLFKRGNDFQNAGSFPRTHIVCFDGSGRKIFRCNLLQGGEVSTSQIHHVDVIAHARAVWSWVVVSKNVHGWSPTHSHLCYKRQQIVRNPLRIFTNSSRGVSSHRIKVPQQCNFPPRVGRSTHVPQNLFNL